MSTAPPAPPPPPPLLPLGPDTPTISPRISDKNSPAFSYPDTCEWASEHPQLREACVKYDISPHNTPFKYKYRHFESILQVGPTCGLVALSMILNGEVTADEMLKICKGESYSCNGEMFSCKNMVKLTEKVLKLAKIDNISYELKIEGLFSHETISRLLNGAVLLVPYDADCNHSPCCRKGHTAHWALVCGVVIAEDPVDSFISDPSKVHVFARHGKSKYLAAWSLEQLERSNRNLQEFSPKKKDDGLTYVLPEGGIGGEDGLQGQFLIFEGL